METGTNHLEAGQNYLPDTLALIDEARAIDPEGFENGRMFDSPLETALQIIWSVQGQDEEAGATDTVGHVFRVGRHVLETDDAGFVRVHSYGTEACASELIEFVRAQEMSYWGEENA